MWRWRYFGWPFPNTFYVKSSAGAGALLRGLYYLRRFVEDYGVVFLALLVIAGWPPRYDRRRRDLFGLTALVLGTFAVYVVRVGGDFIRFLPPIWFGFGVSIAVVAVGTKSSAGALCLDLILAEVP